MVLKYVKMKTSKKIPLKTKNAKIIIFYTGNILEDSRTIREPTNENTTYIFNNINIYK